MEVPGRVQPKILCQPCNSDGDSVLAEGYCETCNEYFCSSCLKVHRKQSVSKNHVIKGKDEMPGFIRQADPCSDRCDVHKTETVNFYCESHNSKGCGDCMKLGHKSCKVRLVSDVSGNYGNSDEQQTLKKKIEDLQKDISASKHEIKKSLKVAEEVKIRIIKEIHSFRREMNSFLDDVEKELLKEVEQISSKGIIQQSQFLDECEDMEKEIKEVQQDMESNSDRVNHSFITKNAQQKIDEYRKTTEQIASKSKISILKFEPCRDMLSLKENRCPLGTITTHYKTFTAHRKKSIAEMKAEFVKQITVKITDDINDCHISGMAMISPDELLLVDFPNESIKILNVGESAVTLACERLGGPWDVTTISSTTVAITLVNKGEILFMNTTNGLSDSHTLKIRKNCKGIDHRDGLMAVSFVSPPAVQILNMKGDILHEVKDTKTFEHPNYIAFRDDSNIVVSDYNKHAVHELTIDGQLKATITDDNLKSPKGLFVTSDGTVVVCGTSNDNSLSMIVPGTRKILPLYVQHVKKHESILICEDSCKMYITENFTDRDNIKVYVLK